MEGSICRVGRRASIGNVEVAPVEPDRLGVCGRPPVSLGDCICKPLLVELYPPYL